MVRMVPLTRDPCKPEIPNPHKKTNLKPAKLTVGKPINTVQDNQKAI